MGETSPSTTVEDLWTPYKELKSTVWKHLNEPGGDSTSIELENVLKKHKQNFFSLLQSPPKNAKSREELKKGMVDGINIKGLGNQVLSKELYQETIILSDMFEINEFVALDLLCTATMQMPYYPSVPRGLVAVLLYYDGRKALVTTLLYLVQARKGVQWCVKVRPDIAKFITDYTNELMEGGLFNRIFDLLRTLDLTKEIEKLQQNLALGGPKHRRQVTDLFNDIRSLLADIIFSWSSQSGLTKDSTVALIYYLRDVKIEEEASGRIDDVNLYLELALLSAFDLSILHTREDGEDAVQLLPIMSENNYIPTILNELLPGKPKWASEGLQALSTFGLAVSISLLRNIPQSLKYQEAFQKEELLIDTAIEMNVFNFMYSTLLENETLYKEQFLYKRIHNLLSDFIFSMYSKVKDLRVNADDIARTMQAYIREGLEAPINLPRYFEYLLLTVGKFYSNNVLDSDYVLCYWNPAEINSNVKNVTFKPPTRSAALFRFIKLAGDILPTPLFVPYITMLSGLASSQQTARYCFNLLNQSSPQVLSSNLSWNHFFYSFSQYYNNLRQEVPPSTDTVYRNRPSFIKGVSPQELEGLHAVLLLIRTVADQDEFSRLAFCEHPNWSPLTVMLGLVTCSIPIPLKADLLHTLATLSKTSENASKMWEVLEASQILVTVPSTSTYVPRGIETELEEIESRMEEYPLTRALLKLLDVLTDFGIPRTLGAGPRNPGFDPYLMFIVNKVFTKYHSRSYRDSAEKWEVAYLCLKLFEKFLNQYDPSPSDFPTYRASEFNSPPGYHLMLQLNNKSEVFNLIMDMLDEGNRYFDSYVSFQGQEIVKECTLSCLNILHRVLVLQNKFSSLVPSASTSLILISINKLLLSINRRSGKPDHCINIAKYLTYHSHLPKHGYVAVKILTHITSSPVYHNLFMNILMSMEGPREIIRTGFVECLDYSGEDDTEITENTKKEILKLLKRCLPHNSPNLTHFLMGFDIKHDVSKTEFQFQGVLGFPRSCLHSIISIMDAALRPTSSIPAALLESIYHLLYLLASNVKSSSPVLRFIRANKEFYRDHLKKAYKNINNGLPEFNQLSWLLKVLAIELKVVGQMKQITYLQSLSSFLVNIPTEDEKYPEMLSMVQKGTFENRTVMPDDIKMDNFMTSLIPYFEVRSPPLETPSWEFFDNSVLNQILQNCQTKSPSKLIDLKKLHQILYDELKSLQGTAVITQIQAITQEIPKVLKYALEINKKNETCSSVMQFVDGWRQIVEVLVLFTPLEILSLTEQQIVIISLLKHLLEKVVRVQLLSEVSRLLSGVVLLLMRNLKKCFTRDKKLQKITNVETENNSNVVKLYFGALNEILEYLIQWIMASNVVDNELRINLYASLVTFLQFTNSETPNEDIVMNDSLFVSRLDSSVLSLQNKDVCIPFSLEVLTAFGEKLIELICQDCIGGQEICKILAMSSFSHLMIVSGNINWIMYISGKGYLKYIIQSIADSDQELRNMQEPETESVKPLYLYMAKVLLLAKLASTKVGAEMLLEQKLLSVFSNMSVFGCHPEITKAWQQNDILEDFLPPIEQRYLQVWLPTLHICSAILTTLGTENHSAISQIMYFLFNHMDVVEIVLRTGTPELSLMFLKELALLTSIISRTANNNLINIMENPNIVQNNRGHLFRIQKLMLTLLPKFILSDDTVKRLLTSNMETPSTVKTSDRLLYAMQIMANLLHYARNVVANNDIEHGSVGVIFYPTLKDPLLTSFDTRGLSNTLEQELSLGIIVQQLISAVNYHHREKATHDLLTKKLKEIPNMNISELKPCLDDSCENADLSTQREKAYEVITNGLEKKKKEMNYCAFIIENCLYLIWAHLDYYMLKAIPRPKNYGLIYSNASLNPDTTLASASEATWKVSTDVISNLKQGLVSLFNESFSKQLSETTQERIESDKGFVEALLRKIKRLIQFVPVK